MAVNPFFFTKADTVVVFPPEKDTAEGGSAHGEVSEILEKPINKDEQVCQIYSAKLAELTLTQI